MSEELAIEKTRKEYKSADLDATLTHTCLNMSLGDVVQRRENARNTRHLLAAELVYNAVFNADVGLIDQIAKRIDGQTPTSKERKSYANYLGNALDVVLDLPAEEEYLNLYVDDPAIIALAKACVFVAMRPDNGNFQKRKEKHTAVDIIFNRTGGRKVEPVREALEEKYIDPDWLDVLPEGEEE